MVFVENVCGLGWVISLSWWIPAALCPTYALSGSPNDPASRLYLISFTSLLICFQCRDDEAAPGLHNTSIFYTSIRRVVSKEVWFRSGTIICQFGWGWTVARKAQYVPTPAQNNHTHRLPWVRNIAMETCNDHFKLTPGARNLDKSVILCVGPNHWTIAGLCWIKAGNGGACELGAQGEEQITEGMDWCLTSECLMYMVSQGVVTKIRELIPGIQRGVWEEGRSMRR